MEKAHRAGWRRLVADKRTADAALVLGCLILTAFAVKASWVPLPKPVIAVAGVVGSVAQWQRRRWPQLAAVVGAGAYPLSGNPGPLLVGLYSGAAYAPRRHTWILAVVGWAGLAGWSWIDEGRLSAQNAVFTALATALVAAVGIYAATRHALLASVLERAERADSERALRDEQARAAERTRIAREMHDVLAHKVSLIALHAGALELGAETDAVRQSAALIRVTAREALQDLRGVLGVLHAGPGARIAGTASGDEVFADLGALVRASEQAGQDVELRDEVGPLPPATARVVFRVAQEGLTNAHRYAPRAPTSITVEPAERGGVVVTVHNEASNGPKMDLPGSGTGLIGLAERIRLAGGSLHSGPVGPGGRDGWRLRAVVPFVHGGLEESTP
jgi:signal transduction histidine kinase